MQMTTPRPKRISLHGEIISNRVRQDHEPRKKRASRKPDDTDEESDSEDEGYEDAMGEGGGDAGFAGADDDEADEEEWDESAAIAQKEVDKTQDKNEEAGASGGKNKSKGARRRRGGREEGGTTAAPGSEKNKRAPRWSNKVRISSANGVGTRNEKWTSACMMEGQNDNLALRNLKSFGNGQMERKDSAVMMFVSVTAVCAVPCLQ